MSPARRTAVAFTVAALACFITAAIVLSRHFVWQSGWTKTNASVTSRDVSRDHDVQGRLVFRGNVGFRFMAHGEMQTVVGTSEYSTRHFSSILHMLERYAPGESARIYYRSNDPRQIRFDVGWTWLNVRWPMVFVAAGAGMLFVPGLVIVGARSQRVCPRCSASLKRFYRYCPGCALPLATGENASPAVAQAAVTPPSSG